MNISPPPQSTMSLKVFIEIKVNGAENGTAILHTMFCDILNKIAWRNFRIRKNIRIKLVFHVRDVFKRMSPFNVLYEGTTGLPAL